MKAGLSKRLILLPIGIVLLASTGTALADNRPYIKTFGGDVMSGGWFSDGSSNCSSGAGTAYQNPAYKSAGFAANNLAGGIITYAKVNNDVSYIQTGGSSSQYATFSLGSIDGDANKQKGFNSDGAMAPVSSTLPWALEFANQHSGTSWGGLFEGNTDQGHCIPDYFGRINPLDTAHVNSLPSPLNWRPIFNNAGQAGTYYGTGPAGSSLNIFKDTGPGDLVLNAGKRLVIAVSGNVFIDHNIVYDTNSTVDNLPKFMLIAKGSIYVDPGVTRLDGVYIAQPKDNTVGSVSSDTGIFWSCHPQATSTDIYYPTNCTTPLAVNGAVIAKQVNFRRVGGNTASTNSDIDLTASTGEDSPSTVTNCTNNPSFTNCHVSELVNYTPAMIMGGSFFDTNSSGAPGALKITSVISLPPVF